MEKFNIGFVLLTIMYGRRLLLITKEHMEKICTEETNSVNDDIDNFFQDIQLGKSTAGEVTTYFLPKLTHMELNLAARKDKNFFTTFVHSRNPDVEKTEMEQSESDSKFVKGWCKRRTFVIEVIYETQTYESSQSSDESSTESSTEPSTDDNTVPTSNFSKDIRTLLSRYNNKAYSLCA